MIRDPTPWLLVFGTVASIVAAAYWRRWHRLNASCRQLEMYADDMLQHLQGTILNVQAIASELASSDPVRQRLEQALDRADQRLLRLREQMQPLCSQQQQDRIQ